MEKNVAQSGLKQIKMYLEDDSLNGRLLADCQEDALNLASNLFGDENSHYRTIRDAAKFSMGVQHKILLEEIDSIIMGMEGIKAIESGKISQIMVDKEIFARKEEVFIFHGRDNDVKEKNS